MFSSTQILLNNAGTDSVPETSPVHDNAKPSVKSSGRWTKEEHQRFIDGVKKFGKNWKQVEEYVGTRTGAQVRSHAQKFFNKLEREQNLQPDGTQIQLSPEVRESLRKMSETSISTNHSINNEGPDDMRMEEIPPLSTNLPSINLKPFIQQAMIESPPNTGSLFQDIHSVPSGSPKLSQFPETNNFRRNPRKMSEDVITKPSVSMFETILSKIRTFKNEFDCPRLSDLVQIDGNSKSNTNHFRTNENNGFTLRRNSNTAFRVPRKFSEDNILLTAPTDVFRTSNFLDLADLEMLAKKLKKN